MDWDTRIKVFSRRVYDESLKLGKNIKETSLEIGTFLEHIIEELTKEAFKLNEKYKDFKYNWIGYAIEREEYSKLFDEYLQNGIEPVEEKLKARYSSDETFADIKNRFSQIDIFNHRLSALEEAFEVHLEGKYFASICLLYPQIEGIIWDIGVSKGFVKRGYNEKTKLKADGNPDPDVNQKPIKYDIRTLLDDFKKNHAVYLLVGHSFKNFLDTHNPKMAETYLNSFSIYQFKRFIEKLLTDMRNPCLHGRNISLYSDQSHKDTFNQLNSAEAILVLESLYGLMEDKSFTRRRTIDDSSAQ